MSEVNDILQLLSLTQVEIDAITSVPNGALVYNSTAGAVQQYQSGQWESNPPASQLTVFGRTLPVIAQAGDYEADQIDDTSSTQKFATQAELNQIQSKLVTITEQGNEQVSLRTLSGTSEGENDNGSFSGSIIPDNSSTKAAIQSLETAVENIPTGGQVDSVNSGTNTDIDDTDPVNPIVNVVDSPNFGGSGQFGGALQVGGPITSGGIPVVLNNDSRLNFYGSEYNQFYSQAVSVTSSPHTTWQNKISDNTTSLSVGEYIVKVSYGWNHNAANSDFESRLLFDGALLGDIFGNGVLHKQEPKDNAGGGNPTGTTQQHGFSKSFPVTVAAAGIKPVVLDFRSDDPDDISGIWEVLIEIYRVS